MSEARYDALTLPAFRSYQFARILMVLAQQIMGVAVAWQVYALTGKALDLGLPVLPAVFVGVAAAVAQTCGLIGFPRG